MNDFSTPSEFKDRLGGRNLYLVGMTGSGKSFTGPYLAKAIQYGFVDMDAVIEKVASKDQTDE